MPQNPTPLEDYVSVIFDHPNDQSTNHHHTHAHHHGILLQTQSTQDTQTLFLVPTPNQQLSHQAPSQPLPQPQEQATASHVSLHLQSPSFEARQTLPLNDTLTNGTMHSQHPEIQHSQFTTILQVPSVGSTGTAVIQVQPALQVSKQINLIEVPPPTLNLVQFSSSPATSPSINDTTIGASNISSSVELVQVPTTLYLANSDQLIQLILPPDMTLQPSTSLIVEQDSPLSVGSPPHSHFENISLAKNNPSAHTLSSDFNQVAMAKLWHSDSDLVNRALTALGRHNSSNDSSSVLPLQHLHLNCSSSVTN